MTGQIYFSVFPYFDSRKGQNSFKKRPVLILSGPRNHDYTVLPISSVSRKENLDPDYDIKIDPAVYPGLGLNRICYVRTHKQTSVHQAALAGMAGDLKKDYFDLYLEIIDKLEQFNKHVIDTAL